jgi:alcohol dehydrogenase YqhD (iron-dependent ADH family)
LKKFKRFTEEVWNISSNGLSDEQVANEGLKAMENWMKKIGVAMNISELGATEDMIDGITEGTLILEGGYKVLTKDEIRQILKKSL